MLVKSLYFNLFVFALKTVGLVQPSFSWSCFFLSRPSLSLSLPFSLFLSSFLALYSLSHRLSHSQQPRKKVPSTDALTLSLSLSLQRTHTHALCLPVSHSVSLPISHAPWHTHHSQKRRRLFQKARSFLSLKAIKSSLLKRYRLVSRTEMNLATGFGKKRSVSFRRR